MKNLINRVQLIGNLGAEVEVKVLENGGKLGRVSLALYEVYSKDGVKEKKTYWHNLTIWGNTADRFSKMCTKGSRVAIQGKLINRQWEDKHGQKRLTTEIVIDEFYILTQKQEAVPF